jgi:diguanylate cyclase (GGDEF)-like protein
MINTGFKPNSKQRLPSPFEGTDRFFRRLLDIMLSTFGLIMLSPLFLLIAIAIKRSSPGPVFYWGLRAGKNNRPFKILKFRTMYERKESYDGPKVTAEDDSRITPFGRILRQTKLNELPQFWNVLIGDMSLVGPRPEDPTITATWPEEVRKEILSVRPGITSPASVVYRNEETLLQSSNLMDSYLWTILPSKLRLDQLYIRNRSILTDIDVIFWTSIALVPTLKDFSIPEHLLYWGPFSRFTSRYLGWFFVDFLISFASLAVAGLVRRLSDPLDLGIEVAVLISLGIATLFSLINTLAGLNNISWSRARAQDALDLAFSSGIVTVVVLVANFVYPSATRFPVSVILMASFLSYFGFVAVRYRSRMVTAVAHYWMRFRGGSMTPLGERVLIVGAGEVAQFAVWLLSNKNLAQAFTIVGMVDDDPRKIGFQVEGYTVINTTSSIPALVKKDDIGLILFAIADIDPTDQDRILSLCQSTDARVIPIPDIIDSLRAQFPASENERVIHFNKVLQNATTDPLTGAYNLPHFLRLSETEFTRSKRYGHPLSMIALKIDMNKESSTLPSPSKAISSQILQKAAHSCKESIRGIDLLCRHNTHTADNTLVILLPETGEQGANLVAQRLRQKISTNLSELNAGRMGVKTEIQVISNQYESFENVQEMLNKVTDNLKPLKWGKDVKTISDPHL